MAPVIAQQVTESAEHYLDFRTRHGVFVYLRCGYPRVGDKVVVTFTGVKRSRATERVVWALLIDEMLCCTRAEMCARCRVNRKRQFSGDVKRSSTRVRTNAVMSNVVRD